MIKERDCPFCGSNKIDTSPDMFTTYSQCLECGGKGPCASTKEKAVKRWNADFSCMKHNLNGCICAE